MGAVSGRRKMFSIDGHPLLRIMEPTAAGQLLKLGVLHSLTPRLADYRFENISFWKIRHHPEIVDRHTIIPSRGSLGTLRVGVAVAAFPVVVASDFCATSGCQVQFAATAVSRTLLWLVSGPGCPGRHPSRAPENPGKSSGHGC